MLIIREVRPDDLPALLKLEESWPPGERATEQQLRTRIERYPQGFLVAARDTAPAELIGSATSCPIDYDPAHPERIVSWNHASNEGLGPENSASMRTETLYLISSVVRTEDRGGEVYGEILKHLCQRALALGYSRILSGAVMPGYDAYCRKHGEIPAADYALMQRGARPLDPFLRVLATFGFVVPDARHIAADYYPDEPSRCYAALVVKELHAAPSQRA
jgi:hypothetical protein